MADIKGHFDGEKVILLEPPPVQRPCEVKVHFESAPPATRTLEEVLKACGPWEDERPAQEIVAELRQLRRSRSSEVQL
ncbi:MAG: hypothetical protein A3F84_12510 [Candidatus Handelsmanbacteria bacterium RIFCSPLOWO2_12_FULL_64_10]|uniref:DUF104 domain-containing protein n=1 Tax=Handelsmanbacteria sp. (strain RIFCSPLOWO2_12_FULL_64_10) TaxID=1817868 RepID=A0A1F6CC82_HANXR|nr:MAG: hypothetical protein A3F84_12510 [Candidatus Handelsmanbacteria bacterium RIFCSPLOWO2_12_FULL_64_10]